MVMLYMKTESVTSIAGFNYVVIAQFGLVQEKLKVRFEVYKLNVVVIQSIWGTQPLFNVGTLFCELN